MSRVVTVAAAQMGPIARAATRRDAVERLVVLLHGAHRRGCRLVVFTEAALTSFFPHWWIEEPRELDGYFEREMPSPAVQPLFDEAARLGIGFYLGFCELTPRGRHFNTSILVDHGRIIGKYRKVHLPGHADYRPGQQYQNLEKRCFEVGDLGFPVWDAFGGRVGMCICNDRRWPETYRVMGLQGVELVMLGYNTPVESVHGPLDQPHLEMAQHLLSLRAGAYQNATWVVATAKAGLEEGVPQIGGSCIVAPNGEIVALATGNGDELVVGDIDLDAGRDLRSTTFNFAAHRRPEHYGLVTERVGVGPPLPLPAAAKGE